MDIKIKRGALHFSLLFGCALLTLPFALPANNMETSSNITTNSDKKLIDFFRNGPTKASITFSEILELLRPAHPCFEKLIEDARAVKREVQTVDLIAVIIENFNHLPLDIQDAINCRHGSVGDRKLRESLEIIFNEAKAFELLESQLSDDCCKRLPWRTLCERVAILLRHNPTYADFANALMAAKDSMCVLFAKLRLKSHLAKLPPRLAARAKEVDHSSPGDVVKRIFWE